MSKNLMWRELIQATRVHCTFFPPVTDEEIADLEKEMGISLSPGLRELLLETDGIVDEYGLWFIWSIHRMKKENLFMRTGLLAYNVGEPSAVLLFFADAGNGDKYYLESQERKIGQSDIYIWRHEDNGRQWIASSIKDYLMQLLIGDS